MTNLNGFRIYSCCNTQKLGNLCQICKLQVMRNRVTTRKKTIKKCKRQIYLKINHPLKRYMLYMMKMNEKMEIDRATCK